MGRIIIHFLPIASIDGMDLCKVDTKMHLICPEVYFTYLVHPHLVFHLSQGYFNASKSVLYIKKLAIGQSIISNKRVITQKRSLMTVITSIKTDKGINRTYNAKSLCMKVWTIIKT